MFGGSFRRRTCNSSLLLGVNIDADGDYCAPLHWSDMKDGELHGGQITMIEIIIIIYYYLASEIIVSFNDSRVHLKTQTKKDLESRA